MTPHPDDDGEPTVAMSARGASGTPKRETSPPPMPPRPTRKRRLSFSAVAMFVLFAAAATGSFFLVQRMKPLAVPTSRVQEAAAPQVRPEASVPAPPQPPPTPDKPASLRQMLNEIFGGRNLGHSVTASVDGGAFRVKSSRPGYVYVLAASTNQSDSAVQFVAMLFPRAADTNNRILAGQTLKLPDLQWPTNTEFLVIVSDERRDIDVLGSLAGKVICAATTPCSESYGAVVLSSVRTRDTARGPAAPTAPKAPPAPAPTAPTARPTGAASRRCSDILERASLGEVLTAEEYTFLKRDCR
jgi:hypothetical protein